MQTSEIAELVDRVWEAAIVPELIDYIRIPCKSPMFQRDWAEAGHLERAITQIEAWCRKQPIEGISIEIVRLPGRTPTLLMEIPATDPASTDTVLLYGHYDKQPEMSGWREDLGPWKPVREGDKLYGRGGADDGYSAFASLLAIRAVRELGGKHARCVVLIEGCEESGSFDLPFYLDALGDRIGTPSLVVCLDSGCGNYEQLWVTTSLRGLVGGTLTVSVLEQGVHSGDASGVVPSSFRIARQLLSRLEDESTGRVKLEALHTTIPGARREQAAIGAKVLDTSLFKRFPWSGTTGPMHDDLTELVLNRTWRPAVSVTGAAGLPPLESAGNVLRPSTSLQVSVRIPPGVDAKTASAAVSELLTRDPPYGAMVNFTPGTPGDGWDAPEFAPWLITSLDAASKSTFGKPLCFMGEGGTIPFMAMMGRKFPKAQFVITGVLGPESNAHGPNEFLHVPTAKHLTACVARVLHDHAAQR